MLPPAPPICEESPLEPPPLLAVLQQPSAVEAVMQRIEATPHRLAVDAYRALEDAFIQVAVLEDLRDEDREAFGFVSAKPFGLCGRCAWRSGCDRCDEAKAWSYACRMTLWHSTNEALRPRAKPRGRPKKAA